MVDFCAAFAADFVVSFKLFAVSFRLFAVSFRLFAVSFRLFAFAVIMLMLELELELELFNILFFFALSRSGRASSLTSVSVLSGKAPRVIVNNVANSSSL